MKLITKNLIIALAVGAIIYYGIPIIGVLISGSLGKSILVSSLLQFNPIYCILVGFVFSMKNGFVWYFPALTALLFLPAVYIFYNDSALVYVLAYAVVSLVGCLLGLKTYKKKNC